MRLPTEQNICNKANNGERAGMKASKMRRVFGRGEGRKEDKLGEKKKRGIM